MSGKWRTLAVGMLTLGLTATAACSTMATNVEELAGGGARPACKLVGTEGDLDVDGGGTKWYGGLNLPDPVQGGWQPAAEGNLTPSQDTLTGTWELFRDPGGTAQIDLRIGKKVSQETQTDEEGEFQVNYYEMSGTVTLNGVAYPIAGCQYKEFRK